MKLLILSLILIQSTLSYADFCRQTVKNPLSFSSVDIAEYAYKPLNIKTVDVYPEPTVYAPKNSIEIRSRGMGWRSGYSPDKQNIQGDPRSLIILLGDKAAGNFGMFMHSEDVLIVPNAKKMTQSILAANRFLKSENEEPISIRYYGSESEAPVERFDYLYASMLNKYPMASSGHFLAHDVALHLGAILLPRMVFDHMNSKTKYFIAYFKELENLAQNLPEKLKQQIIESSEKELKRHEVRIDVTVGNISVMTVERIVGVSNLDHVARLEGMVLSPMKSDTTLTYINRWNQKMLGNLDAIYYSPDRPPGMSDEQYNFIKNNIMTLTQNFISRIPIKDQTPLDLTGEQLIQFVDQRRSALSKWNGQ